MNDQFSQFDSCQGFGDIGNGYTPAMPSPQDSYVMPPFPPPPHPGPVIPIQLKDLMRYIGDVDRLPVKPNSHTMATYLEYGNRVVQYGDVVKWSNKFYVYGYNKARTELQWICFNDIIPDKVLELSIALQNMQETLKQTYRKSQTSSNVQLSDKFSSLSNDFALKNDLLNYATKSFVDTLEGRVARNEIFIGSHEDRLCCHAKKIDQLVIDVKSLSDSTSSYVTWDDFSSKTTSAEVSAIVERYGYAGKQYVDKLVNDTSSALSNSLVADFDEKTSGLASDADLKNLSCKVDKLSADTNASIGELFSKNERRKLQIADLYKKVKNLDGLCAIIDADVNAINSDISVVKFNIHNIKQSLENYVKLSTLNNIVLSVINNSNSIDCLSREIVSVKFGVQTNADNIEALNNEIDAFKQEVSCEYAKNEYLTAYVNLSNLNGESDDAKQQYAVKLSTDGNAYVNVPWKDEFVESAYFDKETRELVIKFKGTADDISIGLSDLVDVYTAGNGLQLSGGEFSVSADYVLRPEMEIALSDYYQKTETSSAAQINDELSTFYYKRAEVDRILSSYYQKTETSSAEELSTSFANTSRVYVTDISAGADHSLVDLHIKKVNAEDFYLEDCKLSDTLYVLTGNVLRAYGMRITDVAEPEDASDAANKQYVDSIAKEEKVREQAEVAAISSDIVSQISAVSSDVVSQIEATSSDVVSQINTVSSEITATIESTSSIITADISYLQDDRDYLSSWISSNFENTDKDVLTTILKQEVSALSDLSVARSLFVNGSQFRAIQYINPETGSAITQTKAVADEISFSTGDIGSQPEIMLSKSKTNINISNAAVLIDATSSFMLNIDGQHVIDSIYLQDSASPQVNILSALSIEARKATATALNVGSLSVETFDDIYAEDISCSVADLYAELRSNITSVDAEFAEYKQRIRACINNISAVNILTSSNIADVISSVIKIKDIIAALSAL